MDNYCSCHFVAQSRALSETCHHHLLLKDLQGLIRAGTKCSCNKGLSRQKTTQHQAECAHIATLYEDVSSITLGLPAKPSSGTRLQIFAPYQQAPLRACMYRLESGVPYGTLQLVHSSVLYDQMA